MTGDFNDDDRRVTFGPALCEPACPPLDMWPARSLIQNKCPECLRPGDEQKTARVLRARRVLEEQ